MMCRTIRQAAEAIQGDGAGSPLENLSAKVANFFEEKLKPHFAAEERMAETLSGRPAKNEDAILQLYGDHKRLKSLTKNPSLEALLLFADELEAHVRFEENTFFPLLESGMTEPEKQKAGADLKESLSSCSSKALGEKPEEH